MFGLYWNCNKNCKKNSLELKLCQVSELKLMRYQAGREKERRQAARETDRDKWL